MHLRLEHSAIRAAVADVQRATQDLAQARQQTDRRVSGLVGSGWTGVAADAFADAWADWLAGAAQVEAGLDAMGQLLDAVRGDLTDQDEGSQAALDHISARIVERLA